MRIRESIAIFAALASQAIVLPSHPYTSSHGPEIGPKKFHADAWESDSREKSSKTSKRSGGGFELVDGRSCLLPPSWSELGRSNVSPCSDIFKSLKNYGFQQPSNY